MERNALELGKESGNLEGIYQRSLTETSGYYRCLSAQLAARWRVIQVRYGGGGDMKHGAGEWNRTLHGLYIHGVFLVIYDVGVQVCLSPVCCICPAISCVSVVLFYKLKAWVGPTYFV